MSVFIYHAYADNKPAMAFNDLLTVPSNIEDTDDFSESVFEREQELRENADFLVFIATPKSGGSWLAQDAIYAAQSESSLVILIILDEEGGSTFSESEEMRLGAGSVILLHNGGKTFRTLEDAANYINDWDPLMS
jgi:hypothetical protein